MVRPRKQFGQHWLRDDRILNQIVNAAQLRSGNGDLPGDRVLEIGPGRGALTRRLLEKAAQVLAVEIDRDLCAYLAAKLGKLEHFLLLQGDYLTLDLDSLLQPFPQFQGCNKVVANIPYNITGPILEKLLGTIQQPSRQPFDCLVLLLQQEVADRLTAQPSSKAYGALSVRIQYLANCEKICAVPAIAFEPPPKVDSAVVRLRPRLFQPAAHDPHLLHRLVSLGFATRRKMLHNTLTSVSAREQLQPLLESLGINPQARAEDLSLLQWVEFSNALANVP